MTPTDRAKVRMFHPETGGEATVTRQQFDTVYAERGWQLTDGDPVASDEDATTTDVATIPSDGPDLGADDIIPAG